MSPSIPEVTSATIERVGLKFADQLPLLIAMLAAFTVKDVG